MLHQLSTEYGQNCVPDIWSVFRQVYPNITAKYESANNESDLPFKMDPAADVIWTVVFSIMLVSAIAGNLVVFWIVLGKSGIQQIFLYSYVHNKLIVCPFMK